MSYIIRYFTEKLTKGLLIILSTAFVLISLSLRLPLEPSYLLPIENEFSSTFEIIAFLLFYLAIFIHFLLNNDRSRHEKIIVSWFFIQCSLYLYVQKSSIGLNITFMLVFELSIKGNKYSYDSVFVYITKLKFFTIDNKLLIHLQYIFSENFDFNMYQHVENVTNF